MGIEQFKNFGKKKEKIVVANYNVIGYTRVSSKEQLVNNSLQYQNDAIRQFAISKKYNLIEMLGETYESASGDYTRLEFMKLIAKVKSMPIKPYGILIYKMSRFSRTGGNAIGLAHELVDTLGVHIFEVFTGRDTLTEQGKLDIYSNLLEARKENIIKLSQTIPGMIKHLENGKWIGKVGRGYDHFGPKVKEIKRIRGNQEIQINAEGRMLKKAWEWKLQGDTDGEIQKKLDVLGLKIHKQFLSKMWRNPFYCGIISSQMLDGNVVKGNWEGLVSEQDFLYIQEILKHNNHGYKHSNSNPLRPLSGFIHCNICSQKMTGYEVKTKKTHYYKCQKCLGVSINAITTPKAKGKGGNELFADFLNNYQLPPILNEVFKEQLKLTYSTLNSEGEEMEQLRKNNLQKLETEFKNLKRRYATDPDFDKEIYVELKTEFEAKINEINSQAEKATKKISNLDNYINVSENIVTNISKYWASEDLETKKRIQELVFPDGLIIDTKNRVYLTKKMNSIFVQSSTIAGVSTDKNKNGTIKNIVPSLTVAKSGFEPETSGL
jgi:site-specific DNA recombinase